MTIRSYQPYHLPQYHLVGGNQWAPNDPAAQAKLWGPDGFGFRDLIDIVNPLQHIPIVSNIYREITGDSIGVAPRMLGGTLFGGPIGLAGAMVNLLIEESTGRDAGGHMIAMVRGGDSTPEPEVRVAAADLGDTLPEASPPAPAQVQAAVAASTAPAGDPMQWQSLFATPQPGPAPAAPPPPNTDPGLSSEQWAVLLAALDAEPIAAGAEPTAVEAARSSPPMAGTAPPAGAGFADAMLTNLDKYAAMMKARNGARPDGAP